MYFRIEVKLTDKTGMKPGLKPFILVSDIVIRDQYLI